MHPFGGTPVCPRCSKLVYAAEQVMGPGRKLYHKPCLACMACNRRLDSLTLVEHNQQPYCKSCHSKQFGTRDLRQANLPHTPDLPTSRRPTSPFKFSQSLPSSDRLSTRSPSPIRTYQSTSSPGYAFANALGKSSGSALPPLIRPTHSLGPNRTLGSPTKRIFPRFDGSNVQNSLVKNNQTGESDASEQAPSSTGANSTNGANGLTSDVDPDGGGGGFSEAAIESVSGPSGKSIPENLTGEEGKEKDSLGVDGDREKEDALSRISRAYSPGPTNTGRPGYGGLPRTVPLSPTRSAPPTYSGYADTAVLTEEPETEIQIHTEEDEEEGEGDGITMKRNGISSNTPIPEEAEEDDEDGDSEDPKLEPTTPTTPSSVSIPLAASPSSPKSPTSKSRTMQLHARFEALNSLRGNVSPHSTGSSVSSAGGGGARRPRPMSMMTTGTRYGAVLGGMLGTGGGGVGMDYTGSSTSSSMSAGSSSSASGGGSPRKWGSAVTPTCPRCGTKVYFAEQVKAIGKTWHKSCLRCTECGTSLDASRLRDHDDQPFCARCYSRLHGPQGSGYALLGKPGS